MAKTQDLRRRIRSITNTRQLTRAMKTVSAAKLRRSQDAIIAARPYAQEMNRVLRSLATRANPENHPLLSRHGDQRIEVVVVTSDRGLCGSFNANITRTAKLFVDEQIAEGREVVVHTVGRKGREFFKRRGVELGREWQDIFRLLDYTVAAGIASYLTERFSDRRADRIHLVYNEFRSAMVQDPVVAQLLPIERVDKDTGPIEDYIYEPTPAELFDALLPRHLDIQVYRGLLESVAAEHAARMTAMDAATRNAGELIDKLTLLMNRVRQASITTEIIEVVSGAQGLE